MRKVEEYVTIAIPKKIVDKCLEKGLDLEEFIINVLIEKLNLNIDEVLELRIKRAEKYLEEAKEYLAKGDSVQASEKLYKSVEECIKALAEYFKIPEAEKAKNLGRWFTWLLDKACRRVVKILNEYRVKNVWDSAYSLHVWGFHEAKLDIDDVRLDLPHIEWLLEYTRNIISKNKYRNNAS